MLLFVIISSMDFQLLYQVCRGIVSHFLVILLLIGKKWLMIPRHPGLSDSYISMTKEKTTYFTRFGNVIDQKMREHHTAIAPLPPYLSLIPSHLHPGHFFSGQSLTAIPLWFNFGNMTEN